MANRFRSPLWTILSRLPNLFTKRRLYTKEYIQSEENELHWKSRLQGRSIFIRHLDTGSSNGAELSIVALQNPRYDIERLGFHFDESPRHADLLLVSGPITFNMIPAVEATFNAMPDYPRYVVTVGDDTHGGGIFSKAYGVLGDLPRDDMKKHNFGNHIEGLVPRPDTILTQLCRIVDAKIGINVLRTTARQIIPQPSFPEAFQ